MIRSSDGVRLLSSHLIQIYEGVFHKNLDSGICTLSRFEEEDIGLLIPTTACSQIHQFAVQYHC
ncbi:hypothetical protein TSUD_347620 [Trifolium subterraneum]|nr:hypothetical protein TSUD_347620 [Trifolium subterraneum]